MPLQNDRELRLIYFAWRHMVRSCTVPAAIGYKTHGGKGISVCERWLDFDDFVVDMRPTYHANAKLYRKHESKGFTPDNCVWATQSERFWLKVDRNGPVPPHCPELGPCWPWTASCTKYGHGRFGLRRGWVAMTHRHAWELTHGEIGDSAMHVCHKCDNPPCCNPDHLFLGTMADNMADCRRKGRNNRGQRNGNVRLTPDDVRAIREMRTTGAKYKDIAAALGLPYGAVSNALAGKNWGWLPSRKEWPKAINALASTYAEDAAAVGVRGRVSLREDRDGGVGYYVIEVWVPSADADAATPTTQLRPASNG
jgi:hypothetical protein